MEQTLAEYIADNSTLSLGTDLFLATLVSGTEEGVIVRFERLLGSDAGLFFRNVELLIMFKDYVAANNMFHTLFTLFEARRGTLEGTWTVRSEVLGSYEGIDKNFDRHVFRLNFEIAYQ